MSRSWIVAAVAVAVWLAPGAARASGGWEWPVTGGPALRYGAKYADAEGGSHTHGGLDIAADEGSAVSASAAGEVVFAGLVPAGEGARAWAVTVLTADGLRVSYLPLASLRVKAGQSVSAAADLGALSGSGDASSDAPHLHLGVKRGSASLDPLAFLRDRTPPVALSGPVSSPGPTGSSSARQRSSASSRAGSRAGADSAARSPVVAGVPDPVGSPAGAVQTALRTLARTRPLARVEAIASGPRVDLGRVRADLVAMRGSILALVARAGLLLLGVACVWPVFRAARSAGSRAVVAPEPARRRR
jgi:hypothetical protein